MAILTMKFGGGSLGTAKALVQVLAIIIEESKRWDRILIVASALEGVTDMLLEAALLARVGDQRGYRRIAATLRTRHMALVDQLPFDTPDRNALKADIDQLLSDMLDQCQKVAKNLNDELLPSMSDAVVAVGERLSARIIAALLRQNDIRGVTVDGTELIVTDDVHGNANPILQRSAENVQDLLLPMLEREIMPVVTGYIGATEGGETTTLGRGGTDFTASVLSALLEAEALWIWTDVDGLMSADPREIANARVIPALDYNEAAELAYFGAKILHAKMIAPLAKGGIPLRIKNIHRPRKTGTEISHSAGHGGAVIKAVTSIQGLALTRPASGSMAGITRLVGNTLSKTLGMSSEVMIASQSSSSSFLVLVIPTSIGIDGVDRLQQALRKKMAEYPEKMPWQIETISLVTAIGNNISSSPGLLAKVLAKLDDIPVLGLAVGPSKCSITAAISQADSRAALARIHELTVKNG
ncbi:MAG: aspartate kinase [Chloroflexota bacterium]|nr:aspartate kinase [Chloroflexota bacterium]